MPVEFLTDEQERRHGRFAGEPSIEQLEKYFHLDSNDRDLIAVRRGDHNRLGFAVQLGTVRFLGTLLANPTDVPHGVVRYLASQLGVDAECLAAYSDDTRWDHAAEIRRRFGYRDFGDPSEAFRLLRWLYARAWIGNQGPGMLFDLATAWLVEHKILLPGASVLARLVARVRDHASMRLWKMLGVMLSIEQRDSLDGLLTTPANGGQSQFDRLRRAPTRLTPMGIAGAIARLREVRSLGVHTMNLGQLPPGRVAGLARIASAAHANALRRMSDERRVATLLAFAHTLARTACDDVLEMFDDFVLTVFGRAENRGTKARIKTLKEFDAAALTLRDACLVFFNPEHTDLDRAREIVYAHTSQSEIHRAMDAILALARPPDDHYYERVLKGYPNLQKFLPLLMETVPLEATKQGQPILDALAALSKLERRHRVTRLDDDLPTSMVTPSWQKHVFPEPGKVDRHAYTFCVVDQLREALHRRDVFVNDSTRWCDPRRLLLEGEAWEAARPRVCRALKRDPTPERALAALGAELDEAYRRAAKNIENNPAVRIERFKGRDTLVLAPLDALPEPESLVTLRSHVHALLPRVDLPDILLEVDAWTHFTAEFTHASEGLSRIEDLGTSVCAVLVAEACNTGFAPLIEQSVSSLTRGRLNWIAQNYIRAETITRANARLVNEQTTIPLAQVWGGGEVASADGMRFTVPVRTINARPNPKYFHAGSGTARGITYYNFSSNQSTGFHGIVVPGTLRDSPYLLNGLLENKTCLKPVQLMTDTSGYSDLVFGLFWLLGFQFSPRLADLGDARLWRMDRSAHYGVLNGIARHKINKKFVADNWDDALRVAGSLLSGTVSASELIRALLAGGRFTTLARVIAEIGRAPKTIHLLTFIDDENYRRSILIQLNLQERRHSLGRAVFHGQRGELRQRYREGQEDQLGALGLVLNAIVLWNTRYMDAALNHLRAQGAEICDEDVERLSPLIYEHINLLGRYHFTIPEPVRRGELRKLRDPNEIGDQNPE